MWKKLKRLWTSDEPQDTTQDAYSPEDEPSHAEMQARPQGYQPMRTPPPQPVDPLLQELAHYDELSKHSPETAPAHLRHLMLDYPHEPRVLRRAAASMQALSQSEDDHLAELAQHFHRATTQNGVEALLRLAESFVDLNDMTLALAFAKGAHTREVQQGKDGLESTLTHAMLLARLGQHEAAIDLLEPYLLTPNKGRSPQGKGPFSTPQTEEELHQHESLLLGARVRYAISALLVGEMERLELIQGDWGEAQWWLSGVAERVRAFPDMLFQPESLKKAPPVPQAAAPAKLPQKQEVYEDEPWIEDALSEDEIALESSVTNSEEFEDFEEDALSEGDLAQRLLFLLYGTVLLDHAEEPRLSPGQIHRWMHALAVVVRQTMPANTRPVWVSPRGEVLARWLGNLLPEGKALPMSARLPRQPILVMLADDADLAILYENAPHNEPFPIFQAIKDPNSLGSPMADLVGVFSSEAWLPFEALEAVRTAERLTARGLSSGLQSLAESEGAIDGADMEGFLNWFKERRGYLELSEGRLLHERTVLDPARPPQV